MSCPAPSAKRLGNREDTHDRQSHAGKKQGVGVAESAAKLLQAQGVFVEIVLSTHPGHAVELAESFDEAGWDGLIAVGGDGTLFEIINGLMKSKRSVPLPLGQVPVGTGLT